MTVEELIEENQRYKRALKSIVDRFKQADEGTLHVRDGVAWAMMKDAKEALNRP